MTITGTAGDDTLTGTSGADTFNMSQGGADTVNGLGGNDIFDFGGTFDSFDKIDGGAGTDTLKLSGDYSGGTVIHGGVLTSVEDILLTAGHSYSLILQDGNIAAGATLKVNASHLSLTDKISFDATAVTTGNFSMLGGAGNDTFTGGAGDDSLNGAGGNDSLIVTGGHDLIQGGDGNDYLDVEGGSARIIAGNNDDTMVLDAVYTKLDTFDGGAGNDILSFLPGTGDLTAVFGAKTLIGVETLQFEESGTVNIRMNDGNVAAGENLFVRADPMPAGATFKFNGAAESDGSYTFLGCEGTNTITGGAGDDTITLDNAGSATGGGIDTIQGGGGNDSITISSFFNIHDKIDGGAGTDLLDFDVASAATIHFADSSFTNIETFAVDTHAGADSFVSADGNVAAGKVLTVDGSELDSTNGFKFDGSAETDGKFHFTGSAVNDTLIGGAGADNLFGGMGQDTMTGGGGNDVFAYSGPAESTGAGRDIITDFDADHDKVDTANTVTSVGAAITTGKLSTASFDTDLAQVLDAAHLAAASAVVFTASTGNLHGHTFLVIDDNGVAGYQAGADYVIELTAPAHLADLSTGNFI